MATIDKYNLQASEEFVLSGVQEITENFQLAASTTSQEGVITGTVTSGSVVLPGATVKVFDSTDTPIAHGITNSQGKYTISSIVKGSYKVTAALNGYLTPIVTPVTVNANSPTTADFNLIADPNAAKNTLFGIIRAAGSLTPLSEVTVNTYSVKDSTQTLVSTTITNNEGQFISPYLADGDYILKANKSGYDQTISGVTTLSGAEIAPLDMTLNPNAIANTGTISGIITDKTTKLPIANATVALYSVVGTTETLIKLTETNGAGRYLFGSVDAASYIVKAFAQQTN